MSWYGYNSDKSDRERQLEWELEEAREREERLREQQRQERDARLQEMRERHEENMRTADNWPEALRKQSYLFRREANMFPEQADEDDLFAPGADACEFALKAWAEEEEKVQPEIDALLAQIEAIKDGIRERVADRVEAQYPNVMGWKHVAGALRENNPNAWLYW